MFRPTNQYTLVGGILQQRFVHETISDIDNLFGHGFLFLFG